jgi:hypothetical protein
MGAANERRQGQRCRRWRGTLCSKTGLDSKTLACELESMEDGEESHGQRLRAKAVDLEE